MAQVKKISDLNEKTSVSDNDIFLMVDSQATGYPLSKKVKALTIKNYVGGGGGSNLLVYDLSQFQSNANVVYPAGTIIYYRRNNGQVTGVYKVSDGVTSLGNLPLQSNDYIIQSDDFTHITQARCLFDKEISNYNSTGYDLAMTASRMGRLAGTTLALSNVTRMILTPIWYPIKVYGIGVHIVNVTTAGTIKLAIYTPNATYNSWSLVSGSDTPDISVSTTGYTIYTYPTPFTLDVGIYGFLYTAPSTTNVRIPLWGGIGNSLYQSNGLGLRYQPSMVVQTNYIISGYLATIPTTISGVLQQGYDHIWGYLLLCKPAI